MYDVLNKGAFSHLSVGNIAAVIHMHTSIHVCVCVCALAAYERRLIRGLYVASHLTIKPETLAMKSAKRQ